MTKPTTGESGPRGEPDTRVGQPPPYIREAGVIGSPVHHEWEGSVHYNREDPRLLAQLAALSVSSVLALALGTAEWIWWRLRPLSRYDIPAQVIEAGWAFAIDPAYARLWRSSQDSKRNDPIDGPLWATNLCLARALGAYKASRFDGDDSRGGVARACVCLVFLARHVLPAANPFDAWLKAAITRLKSAHPAAPTDPFGTPVPREALDPAFDYQPGASGSLLSAFLTTLDPQRNPFLRSSDEMREAGFSGTP